MKTNKVIGIDLGTTHTLAAIHTDSGTRMITDRTGTVLFPSVVARLESGERIAGPRAKAIQDVRPEHVAYSVKRLIGRTYSELQEELSTLRYPVVDEDGHPRIQLGPDTVSPVELSANILRGIKRLAETDLGEPVSDCVITVPAYFNDNQRNETRVAAQLAGLTVRKMINEPTAAALAYGLNRHESAHIAVYDLGGGTFDVSILKLHNGIFEVLSTRGDTQLGGDDFDRALAQLLATRAGVDSGVDLISLARDVKHRLSEAEAVDVRIPSQLGADVKTVIITKDDYTSVITPILERTRKIMRKALRDANMSPDQIDHTLLVGGSTRTPAVKSTVADVFGKPPLDELDPDLVVAMGAAVQGSILSGELTETVLLDVTPLSLGMETVGGIVEKFISRNSKIPCTATETFTTSKDNQTAVSIHILQGERELVQDNISLGRFVLRNIPAQAAGLPRIEVTFALDGNGILTVTAIDQRTGETADLSVQPMTGLTDEKVEEMLMASLTHAKEDVNQRLLIDARTEADAILLATRRALSENGGFLNESERAAIDEAMRMIEDQQKTAHTHTSILEAIDMLDALTQPFAERIMNATIQTALTEKSIHDIE